MAEKEEKKVVAKKPAAKKAVAKKPAAKKPAAKKKVAAKKPAAKKPAAKKKVAAKKPAAKKPAAKAAKTIWLIIAIFMVLAYPFLDFSTLIIRLGLMKNIDITNPNTAPISPKNSCLTPLSGGAKK